MRKRSIKAIAGLAAFALPSLVAVVGMCLDRSRLRYNVSYAASIPLMLWSSVILAAVVPGVDGRPISSRKRNGSYRHTCQMSRCTVVTWYRKL